MAGERVVRIKGVMDSTRKGESSLLTTGTTSGFIPRSKWGQVTATMAMSMAGRGKAGADGLTDKTSPLRGDLQSAGGEGHCRPHPTGSHSGLPRCRRPASQSPAHRTDRPHLLSYTHHRPKRDL